MKQLVSILLGLLVFMNGYSKRISEQEAYLTAQQFLRGKSIKANPRLVSGAKGAPASKNYYLFNVEDNGGFVIVSGDDRTRQILGYSDHGEFDTSRIPSSLQWLLDSYDMQISSLTLSSVASDAGSIAALPDITAMIGVQWGQYEPYNNDCPTFDGMRCATGCVATAMAQLLSYHKWPLECTPSIPSYTTLSHGIFVSELPPAIFDWDRMDAVSIPKLMRYCGQSVKMDYSPWESGANVYDVPSALITYFGFTRKISLESREDYSDEKWNELIYKELKEGRPVLYSASSLNDGAHSFIVDGYHDSLYHINWGWEGVCDGFFTLETLNPLSDQGFIEGQMAMVEAYPADPDEGKNAPWLTLASIDSEERLVIRSNAEDDFPYFNVSSNFDYQGVLDIETDIAVALYQNNELLRILSSTSITPYYNGGFGCGLPIKITSDIPNGNYQIISLHKLPESNVWLRSFKSDRIYLDIDISETNLIIRPMPERAFEDDIFEYGIHTVNGISYRFRAEYGYYRAYPQSLPNEEAYVGELYIPDSVMLDDIEYKVSNVYGFANGLLDQNSEVTSLSTPIAFKIYDAQALRNIEFRDGVTKLPEIYGCPILESIVADSPSDIPVISHCVNLKSLYINNTQEIILRVSAEGTIWSKEDLPELSDIYFTGYIPPVFFWEYSDFVEITPIPCENVTIHVPNGTKDVFVTHGWNGWKIVDDMPEMNKCIKWDYCGNDVSRGNGIGYKDKGNNVEFAMKVPTEYLNAYQGCKITAIEFFAGDPTEYSDYHADYVFLTIPGKDYCIKQAVNSVHGNLLSVKLTQPYIITNEDLFVGIGGRDYNGVSWANSDIEENALWMRVMNEDSELDQDAWEMVCSPDDMVSHPVPIHMIIEGDDLPDDIMILSADVAASDSVSKSIALRLRNRSPRIIRNITLDWTLDGMEMSPISLSKVLPQNYNEVVYVDLPVNLPGRNHTVEFRVAEIEGKPDTIYYNNVASTVFTSSSSTIFPRKMVLEEATGTWCGYCPSGLATIEVMKKRYPDNFIAIGVHSDSEMSIPDSSYDPFLGMVSYFPSARLNRTDWIDLTPFDLGSEMELGEAMIKVSASFAEDNCVAVETATTFGFNDQGEDHFRIAYVVVEDNVGPYMQNNNYSDPDRPDMPDDYLNWWTHQNQYALYVYDDVVRGIYDYDGIPGLFPEMIEEGKEYASSYMLRLPENFDRAENLKIITLLIDVATGEIINADQAYIEGEYDSVSEIEFPEDVKIRTIGSVLIIENASGKDVVISRIDGSVYNIFKATSNTEYIELSSGIFLINAGGHIAKIIIN